MATGKISRLPREIREQVNQRLDAGEPGNRLVAWLNELPEVQALLAAEFGGATINEQNLTNWKQGGFREWRVQHEARTFAQQPAGAAAVVTPEQLSTALAVRYVMAIREWQESPVPVERRWRTLRVMMQDVLKLQRGKQLEDRLALEGERLQFAVERFEEGRQTDVRRVMVGFLAAARQWPEVGEALATAFRLFRERKGAEREGNKAELESIKVNQGGIKNEEAQNEMGGCLDDCGNGPSPLREHWFPAGRCAKSAVGGARMDENLAKLKPIKVDQGDIFICMPGRSRTRTRRRTRTIGFRHGMARHHDRLSHPPTAHRCDSPLQNNSVWSAQIQPRPAHLSVDNRPRRLDF